MLNSVLAGILRLWYLAVAERFLLITALVSQFEFADIEALFFNPV